MRKSVTAITLSAALLLPGATQAHAASFTPPEQGVSMVASARKVIKTSLGAKVIKSSASTKVVKSSVSAKVIKSSVNTKVVKSSVNTKVVKSSVNTTAPTQRTLTAGLDSLPSIVDPLIFTWGECDWLLSWCPPMFVPGGWW